MKFPSACNEMPELQSGNDVIIPNAVTYRGTIALISAWLCLGMLIYLPNHAGMGLALPFNIITWGIAALISLWLVFRLPASALRPVTAVPRMKLMPLGAVLWSLPLLWAPSFAAFRESVPHVAALWGLLGFLWLLRRQPLTCGQRRGFLLVIAAAALLQAFFGFAQVTFLNGHSSLDGIHPFYYKRPFGIFQQANVLGSFVATGIMCLLISQVRGYLAGIALFFMTFMVVIIQSRTAWLAEGAGVILLAVSTWRQTRTLSLLLKPFLLIIAGTATGIALLNGWLTPALRMLLPDSMLQMLLNNMTIVEKSGSTLERWAIIKTTMDMILNNPLFGVGYGEFESAFMQQAQLSGGPFMGNTLTYPHNELLYAWSEGGIFALCGLLLMVADIFCLLWRRGGWRIEGLVLLLPLIAHINLEYPLYLSVPHGIMLVLLLNVALAPASFISTVGIITPYVFSKLSPGFIRCSIIAISVFVLCFMAGALQTQQLLTIIEQQGMVALRPVNLDSALSGLWNPVSQAQRLDYDRHVALLIDYNQTHESKNLIEFDRWARDYLTRHNDANVYSSEVMILSHANPERGKKMCRQAHAIWPRDARFNCI